MRPEEIIYRHGAQQGDVDSMFQLSQLLRLQGSEDEAKKWEQKIQDTIKESRKQSYKENKIYIVLGGGCSVIFVLIVAAQNAENISGFILNLVRIIGVLSGLSFGAYWGYLSDKKTRSIISVKQRDSGYPWLPQARTPYYRKTLMVSLLCSSLLLIVAYLIGEEAITLAAIIGAIGVGLGGMSWVAYQTSQSYYN